MSEFLDKSETEVTRYWKAKFNSGKSTVSYSKQDHAQGHLAFYSTFKDKKEQRNWNQTTVIFPFMAAQDRHCSSAFQPSSPHLTVLLPLSTARKTLKRKLEPCKDFRHTLNNFFFPKNRDKITILLLKVRFLQEKSCSPTAQLMMIQLPTSQFCPASDNLD